MPGPDSPAEQLTAAQLASGVHAAAAAADRSGQSGSGLGPTQTPHPARAQLNYASDRRAGTLPTCRRGRRTSAAMDADLATSARRQETTRLRLDRRVERHRLWTLGSVIMWTAGRSSVRSLTYVFDAHVLAEVLRSPRRRRGLRSGRSSARLRRWTIIDLAGLRLKSSASPRPLPDLRLQLSQALVQARPRLLRRRSGQVRQTLGRRVALVGAVRQPRGTSLVVRWQGAGPRSAACWARLASASYVSAMAPARRHAGLLLPPSRFGSSHLHFRDHLCQRTSGPPPGTSLTNARQLRRSSWPAHRRYRC